MAAETGMVFDIQKFSIHDGPGIRTTVFLKGCPLRCAWCHNPESQSGTPVISYRTDTCLHCGACVPACPYGCHTLKDDTHTFDRHQCHGCGRCAEACPSRALEKVGRRMTVGEVIEEVKKDIPFYGDDGGLTVSGGEPLAQTEFTAALLKAAKKAGLHTTVETCGSVPAAALKKVLPYTDLFLFDFKAADKDHKKLTGASRQTILANLKLLHDAAVKIRLRIPLVAGMNATAVFQQETLSLLNELPDIEAVEIMPYHRLAEGKYKRFGLEKMKLKGTRVPSAKTLGQWQDTLRTAEKNILCHSR